MNMLNNASDYLLGNVNKDKAKDLAAASAEVTIEDNWKGDIKAGAFEGLENPVSINTNDITGIENGAFKDCKRLETLIMPNIKRVGENVFEGCNKLHKVDVKDEDMAEIVIEKIKACNLLQRIDIYIAGKFKVSIKNNCEYLFNDKVPELMKGNGLVVPHHYRVTRMRGNVISDGAFKDVGDLLQRLNILEVTEIEGNPFENCTNLKRVEVKDKDVAKIIIEKMMECGLKQSIGIGIEEEGLYMYIENNRVYLSASEDFDWSGRYHYIVGKKNWTLPYYDFIEDLEYVIPNKSMSDITNLEKLNTNKTTIIGDEAFEGCKNLKKIYLPDVKEIGKEVFKGCEKLCNVHVRDDMVDKIKDVLIESGLSQQVYIHVNGAIVAYLHDKLSKAMVEEAVVRNESWILSDDIEIPGYYIKIDDHAFRFSSATKINTNKVTSIGDHVLTSCNKLEELCLPNVVEIGEDFCKDCPKLRKIIVKDEKTANLIKDMLDSYDEKRSADINIYREGENEPLLTIKGEETE